MTPEEIADYARRVYAHRLIIVLAGLIASATAYGLGLWQPMPYRAVAKVKLSPAALDAFSQNRYPIFVRPRDIHPRRRPSSSERLAITLEEKTGSAPKIIITASAAGAKPAEKLAAETAAVYLKRARKAERLYGDIDQVKALPDNRQTAASRPPRVLLLNDREPFLRVLVAGIVGLLAAAGLVFVLESQAHADENR